MSDKFRWGAKAGNTGLKRVIRKIYESCVKLRKVKCNFSNMLIMI